MLTLILYIITSIFNGESTSTNPDSSGNLMKLQDRKAVTESFPSIGNPSGICYWSYLEVNNDEELMPISLYKRAQMNKR